MNQEQLVYTTVKNERQGNLVYMAKSKLYAAITNEEDYDIEIRKGLIEAAIWDILAAAQATPVAQRAHNTVSWECLDGNTSIQEGME